MAINLRSTKGSALTHQEMDTNLTSFYVSSSLNDTTLNFYTYGTGSFSATTHSIDLGIFLDNTDRQTLSIDGNDLSISNGNTIVLPIFDGNYSSLSNLPDLFDGNYNSLSNLPTLFDGNYSSLSNLPDLFDGNYNSLSNLPTLFDGDYNSLDNLPTIPTVPTNVSAFTNDAGYITSSVGTLYTAGTGLTLTGTEFSLTDPHFSGDYNDLDNKPTVSLSLVTNDLTLTKLDGTTDVISLLPYLDEDARAIASGTLDSVTGIVTFTRDDATTFTLDLSDLLDDTNLVTSVNGAAGVVVLTTDNVDEGTTNFYDKEVFLTGQNITINGTYPYFQLTGSATVTETDPVFQASDAAGITSTDISNWDTAHGWGDHSTAGYLTSYTETDPVFLASDAAGITSTDISNWDTAHGWGDHSTAGYLTSYTETDPIFGASAAAGITATDISNWDTAHGWGNHADAGYLTSYSEVDTLATVTSRGNTTSTTITAANFITTSDQRLKSNIKPISEGLNTLKRFLSYEYVKDGQQDAGFLAQEVQQAIPYSVFEGKNGYLTMNDRPILAHMHKAILELEQRIAAIESKLD